MGEKPTQGENKDWHPAVKEYLHTESNDYGRMKFDDAEQQNLVMGMAELEDRERDGEMGLGIKGYARRAIFDKAVEENGGQLDGEAHKELRKQLEELGYENSVDEAAAEGRRLAEIEVPIVKLIHARQLNGSCLLYTSDAADE